MRQKCILLAFIEAVYLIHKQNGAAPQITVLTRPLDSFADLFYPGGHSGQAFDIRIRIVADHFRQGGFPGARRSPQNHGVELSGADSPRQRFALCQQVSLSDILFQCPRPHSGGQRLVIVLRKIERKVSH